MIIIIIIINTNQLSYKGSLCPFWKLETSMLLRMFGLFLDKKKPKICNVNKN